MLSGKLKPCFFFMFKQKAASVLLQTMKNDCHDKEHIVTSLALLFPYTEFTEKDQVQNYAT